MKFTTKNISESKAELIITVEPAEYDKFLKGAAVRISDQIDIKGFRRGHVPYDSIVQAVGIMAVYEEAIKRIVPSFYAQAIKEGGLETIGAPEIEVTKLAPGNPIELKVKAALVPFVELPDIKKIRIEKKNVNITDAQVDSVISDIQKMRAKEIISNEAAGKNDKIVVNMNMFAFEEGERGAAIPGGEAKSHAVYLSENYYIPQLPEKLIGMKKGDKKSFNLRMPENHYQKDLAGKEICFEIEALDVYKRELPELGDEFAKGVGQESMEKLRELVKNNLVQDAERKENDRYDVSLLNKLIEEAKFGEIPNVVIESEKDKMFRELEHGIQRRGQSMDEYLNALKKTKEELLNEWTDEAVKRAKIWFFMRSYAQENNINVGPEEIQAEKDAVIASFRNAGGYDMKEIENKVNSEHAMENIIGILQNRKVLEEIKKIVQ